jgi:tRNA G18 (ribose-2'-O)-methylase SpoU
MIVEVTDPFDPRIEPYRQIRERDLVGRQGLFIAEGRVVIEKALAAGRHPLVSVLVAQARLAALAPLLDQLGSDVPIYAAAQPVMDAIAGFPVHRGLLALGRRCEPQPAAMLAALPTDALVVALAGIANHDNMGGVFRNVAAFGADAVLLDATCCDPLYRKAIRVSVGAALTTELTAAGFEVVALSPRGAVELGDLPSPAGRTAALIGAEGPGLSLDLLARARTVRIDMASGFDSLNVATTSGIFLHHLRAGRAAR